MKTIKFILDAHLGKLAKHLRLAGFDALFDPNYDDDEIVKISLQQNRIILTRDRGLLKDHVNCHGYWVNNIHPTEQFIEIIKEFNLAEKFDAFTPLFRM